MSGMGAMCIGWLVGCVSFEFLSHASFGGISFYPIFTSRSLCQKSRQTECQVSVYAFNLHLIELRGIRRRRTTATV
ncbi:hypothetical protein B0H13DRAFT_1977653 [Mycena leptocephala]|nr:hypothetical protein B0H13DRAFT_1977653 [Mycena leptocephala]